MSAHERKEEEGIFNEKNKKNIKKKNHDEQKDEK